MQRNSRSPAWSPGSRKPVPIGAVRLLCFALAPRPYVSMKTEPSVPQSQGTLLVTAAYRSIVKINIKNLLASSLRSRFVAYLIWSTCRSLAERGSPTLPVLTTSSNVFPSVIAFDSGLSVVWLQAQPCKKNFFCWIGELVGSCDIVRSDATEIVGLSGTTPFQCYLQLDQTKCIVKLYPRVRRTILSSPWNKR